MKTISTEKCAMNDDTRSRFQTQLPEAAAEVQDAQ